MTGLLRFGLHVSARRVSGLHVSGLHVCARRVSGLLASGHLAAGLRTP